MQNEFNTGYQYNRCISRGICSINPATASLQEVIIGYLKIAAFYGLKLQEFNVNDKKITNLILNTISIVSSNYEISEANFNMINSSFRTEIPRIIREYEDLCKKNNTSPDTLAYNTSFFEEHTLSEYIRLGEKEFLKRNNENLTINKSISYSDIQKKAFNRPTRIFDGFPNRLMNNNNGINSDSSGKNIFRIIKNRDNHTRTNTDSNVVNSIHSKYELKRKSPTSQFFTRSINNYNNSLNKYLIKSNRNNQGTSNNFTYIEIYNLNNEEN